MKNIDTTPIQVTADPITSEALERFRVAVGLSENTIPPTFPTLYRRPEFEWLSRLGVDLRNLLHTEQRYEYHTPFQVGDIPQVTTRLKSLKERRYLQYIVFDSDIRTRGVLRVIAITTFVVRLQET